MRNQNPKREKEICEKGGGPEAEPCHLAVKRVAWKQRQLRRLITTLSVVHCGFGGFFLFFIFYFSWSVFALSFTHSMSFWSLILVIVVFRCLDFQSLLSFLTSCFSLYWRLFSSSFLTWPSFDHFIVVAHLFSLHSSTFMTLSYRFWLLLSFDTLLLFLFFITFHFLVSTSLTRLLM